MINLYCNYIMSFDYFNIVGDPNRTGGGVCLHIKSSLRVETCDLYLEDDHCESLFNEINNNDKTIIVDVLYCPPDSALDTFCYKLENLLHKLKKLKKRLYTPW